MGTNNIHQEIRDAVTKMCLKFNNKYWLFTNLDTSNSNDYSSELHIFYADNIESSEWKPHALNPVIFDSKRARNGGMIYSEKKHTYRVFCLQITSLHINSHFFYIFQISKKIPQTFFIRKRPVV